MKRALITGVTGQDGSYLAEFLLKNNYEVHGLIRRSSSFNTGRIDHIINDEKYKDTFFFHHGDLTDPSNLNRILERVGPNEIYNLAAQSHVKVSFDKEKPDGTQRKLLDSSLLQSMGWSAKISFKVGIKKTYDSYISNFK